MELTWLGTATFEIVCGGKRIVIDPYFQRYSACQNEALETAICRADLLLITHPHLDHFCDIGRVVGLTSAPVYVARRGIDIAAKRKVKTSSFVPVVHGLTVELGGGAYVRAYASRHIVFDEELRRTTIRRALKPKNFAEGMRLARLNRIFSITDADVFGYELFDGERTAFLLGSANLRDDVDYPEGADLVVFPLQGRTDITAYSAPLIERLSPSRILLSHFDDAFPPVSARVDTSEFIRLFPFAAEAELFTPFRLI